MFEEQGDNNKFSFRVRDTVMPIDILLDADCSSNTHL